MRTILQILLICSIAVLSGCVSTLGKSPSKADEPVIVTFRVQRADGTPIDNAYAWADAGGRPPQLEPPSPIFEADSSGIIRVRTTVGREFTVVAGIDEMSVALDWSSWTTNYVETITFEHSR